MTSACSQNMSFRGGSKFCTCNSCSHSALKSVGAGGLKYEYCVYTLVLCKICWPSLQVSRNVGFC